MGSLFERLLAGIIVIAVIVWGASLLATPDDASESPAPDGSPGDASPARGTRPTAPLVEDVGNEDDEKEDDDDEDDRHEESAPKKGKGRRG